MNNNKMKRMNRGGNTWKARLKNKNNEPQAKKSLRGGKFRKQLKNGSKSVE